jgi:RNA polymerase sigma factor (sigma-70 family)
VDFVDENPQQEAESIAQSLGSITIMYERARDGDSRAPEELWNAYSKRLLGLARAVLRQRGITPADASEDSIVNAAFAKFFDAISRGKYHDVADRHDLWRLLAVITRNSALNEAKRSGNRKARVAAQSDSIFTQHTDDEPAPEEVAALSDTIESLERQIRERATTGEQSERIIQVMTMTLSGHTQREISEAIGQSEVTVRRNLTIVRELLSQDEES